MRTSIFGLLAAATLMGGCKQSASNERPATSSSPPALAPRSSDSAPPRAAAAVAESSTDLVPSNEVGTSSFVAPWSATSIVDVNGDGTDDVVGLVHVLSNTDDQLRVAAFDGSAGRLLWTSPRVQPTGAMPRSSRVMTFAGGGKLALANGWTELESFDLGTGRALPPLSLPGIPGVRSCADPDAAAPLYLSIAPASASTAHASEGVLVDLAAASATAVSAPPWCMPSPRACAAFRRDSSHAACAGPEAAPTVAGFEASYVLSTKEASIAIGNATTTLGSAGVPMIVRFDPPTKRVLWTETIAGAKHDHGNYKDSHAVSDADVTAAGVIVVIDVVAAAQTWEQRLLMLALENGAPRFETTVPRPLATAPRVVGRTLYVPRGGTLEARDPATGIVRRVFGGEKISGSRIVEADAGAAGAK